MMTSCSWLSLSPALVINMNLAIIASTVDLQVIRPLMIADRTHQNSQEALKWSGSQGPLPDPSPIRTVLVGFPTYGSSLSKVAIQATRLHNFQHLEVAPTLQYSSTAFLR